MCWRWASRLRIACDETQPRFSRGLHPAEAAPQGATSKAALALGLVVLVVGGCGSEAPAPPEVPLCDGSDGLTLTIFAQGQPARDPIGGGVRVENGFPSFAVDGQCSYYMSGGWYGAGSGRQARDEGWRRGMVDSELRRTLESLAGAADLESVNECSPIVGGFDVPAVVLANTRSAVVCTGRGRGSMVFEAIQARAAALWMRGQPLDQDLHIVAVEGGIVDGGQPVYDWPSRLALRDYLQDQNELFIEPVGRSRRVAAADARELRDIRERFLRDIGRTSAGSIGGIQMTDGEITAAVFLRDALPYEDARGLWPPLPTE
jgi:hypothetical protein